MHHPTNHTQRILLALLSLLFAIGGVLNEDLAASLAGLVILLAACALSAIAWSIDRSTDS